MKWQGVYEKDAARQMGRAAADLTVKAQRNGKEQRYEMSTATAQPTEPQRFPFLTGDQVLNHLALHGRVDSIRGLIGLNDPYFDALCRPAITAVARCSQLIPAAEAHHHRGAGGLLLHALEVVEAALRRRKGVRLPRGAQPEEQIRLQHVWTYAVFVGALLHDIGKTITLCRLTTEDGKTWSPMSNSIPKGTYSIEWRRMNYRAHERLGPLLFERVVPAQGREWMAQEVDLLVQLSASLYGDYHNAGELGELVHWADQQSAAQDVAGTASVQALPGAKKPMVDQIMEAIRHLAVTQELPRNRSGGAIWIKEGDAWLVCGTAAKAAIQHLRAQGATPPERNERVFDILQDHGIAKPNPQGRAVWKMKVVGADYEHHLTMLRVEVSKIFGHDIPPEFEGGILPQDEKAHRVKQDDPASNLKQKERTETEAAPKPNSEKEAAPAGETKPEAETTAGQKSELSEDFMQWISDSVSAKTVLINKSGAWIHFVPEGMLLVSPRVFKEYGKLRDARWTDAQKAFNAAKLSEVGADGKNLFSYAVGSSGKLLKGMLIKSPERYIGEVPKCNPTLTKWDANLV